jgi:hypothetical protein
MSVRPAAGYVIDVGVGVPHDLGGTMLAKMVVSSRDAVHGVRDRRPTRDH